MSSPACQSPERALPLSNEGDIRLLANIFLQSVISPFIRILPSDSANQPIPTLLCIAVTLMLGYRLAINAPVRFSLLLVAAALVNSIVTSFAQPAYSSAILLEVMGYVIVAVTFVFSVNFQSYFSTALIKANIIFLLLLALVQRGAFSGTVSNASYAILGHIISRAPTSAEGSRGVALMTPEPSFAAQIICLLFFLWYFLEGRTASRASRRFYFTCFVLLAALCASGSLTLYFGVASLCYVFLSRRNAVLALSAVVVGGLIFYFGFVVTGLLPQRIFLLFNAMLTPFQQRFADIDWILLLTLLAGSRGPLAVIALSTPFFAPFGNGLGHWNWGIVQAADRAGVHFEQLPLREEEIDAAAKPNGFGGTVVYEMGLIGVAFIGYLIVIVLRALRVHRGAPHYWIIACAAMCGLAQIIVSGLTFLGCPWVLLALTFRKKGEI